jgi:hypothetical protein
MYILYRMQLYMSKEENTIYLILQYMDEWELHMPFRMIVSFVLLGGDWGSSL